MGPLVSNLQQRIARRQRQVPQVATQTRSIPIASLGWNARDSLADMDPRFALVMENYLPQGNEVVLRGGAADHVTGFPGVVETIHEFASQTTRKLVAFSGGNVYDATTPGAVGAPISTGYSSNRWFGVNAGVGAAAVAIYANGADNPISYNGSTVSNAGLTGPVKATGITISKKRLWVIENGSGEAWYGAPEQITGALNKFDVGSVSPRGGNLRAIGNLTIDGGLGVEDLTVFVMASGDVMLYAGTDPGDAANWSLRGVWDAGDPVGERCLVPFGNDLVLITNIGFISLLNYTVRGLNVEQSRVSDNIRNAVNDASRVFDTLYGWEGIYHPTDRQLLFNIPTVQGQTSDQYVMNSVNGGWGRFRGWNAFSFARLGTELYFGGVNKVQKANTGGLDGTLPITGKIQSAWNYFQITGREKHFKQYRPNIRSGSEINLGIGIGVDFRDPAVMASASTGAGQAAMWNVDDWNAGTWQRGLASNNEWRGAGASGYTASVIFETVTSGTDVRFLSTDFIFEVGGEI